MSTALKSIRTPNVTGEVRRRGQAASVSGSGRAATLARRAVSVVTTALFVVALAGFLALAVGPRIFGYQTMTMLTGSMSPLINPGDVVVTLPVPTSEIRTGDIITYHIPVEDQRVETHRVVEVTDHLDGSITVQTKGDANNGVDPWLATISAATVDRHVATIPHVGAAIRTLREPVILNTLMYGAPAVLVVGMLASIWNKKPESDRAEAAVLPTGTNA
ncbi:signal peptidase I [Pseudarthrobacter oxydans]|uniref:signal peptidase I n=1 Tax=Pseudarthrobacter oxydans TaxID=1671 RepID=UPI001573011E|nr:signal peptidase I [Pseudarthrobacter oxydans]NSX37181.1 signal peptidase I [Pseudarthrobacter oxydans]